MEWEIWLHTLAVRMLASHESNVGRNLSKPAATNQPFTKGPWNLHEFKGISHVKEALHGGAHAYTAAAGCKTSEEKTAQHKNAPARKQVLPSCTELYLLDKTMMCLCIVVTDPCPYSTAMEPPGRIFSIFANSHSLLHKGQALRVLSQR